MRMTFKGVDSLHSLKRQTWRQTSFYA